MIETQNNIQKLIIAHNSILKNQNVSLNNSNGWIEINQPEITQIITDAYADTYKLQILTANSKSMIIDELVKNTEISKSTVYKKCNELIDVGLMIPVGIVQTAKKLNRQYERLIININFEYGDKKIIHIKINKKATKKLNLEKDEKK